MKSFLFKRHFPSIARRLSAFFVSGVFVSIVSAADTDLKDWQNPRLTGLNNLPPHATMVICPDAQTALKIGPVCNAERVKSPFYRSLNGDWKYHYAANHTGRVPDFWKPDFDDSNWETIPVPVQCRDVTATASRSTSTSSIRGPGTAWNPIRRSCRRMTRTTRSTPIAARSTVPRDWARPPRLPHLRRRQLVLLPLDQRPEGRPGQGQPHAGRVRHHAVS